MRGLSGPCFYYLLKKAFLAYKVINSHIIIVSVIYDKPANLISKAKFKYNAANSISVVKATILAKLL